MESVQNICYQVYLIFMLIKAICLIYNYFLHLIYNGDHMKKLIHIGRIILLYSFYQMIKYKYYVMMQQLLKSRKYRPLILRISRKEILRIVTLKCIKHQKNWYLVILNKRQRIKMILIIIINMINIKQKIYQMHVVQLVLKIQCFVGNNQHKVKRI